MHVYHFLSQWSCLVIEMPRPHFFQVESFGFRRVPFVATQIHLTREFKKRVLASSVPCLAITFCPVLSIKMSSTSCKSSVHELPRGKKSSLLAVLRGNVTPKPHLQPVTAIARPNPPASTGRIRDCPGPLFRVLLTFLQKLKAWPWFPLTAVLLWTWPIVIQRNASSRCSSLSCVNILEQLSV